MINIAKGISNVIAGHLIDSTIYARKTVESVRYAAFIRDNPSSLPLWADMHQRKRFENQFREWWRDGGKALVNKEFPQNDQHYKYASAFGPHSKPFLFIQQHIEEENGFRIWA